MSSAVELLLLEGLNNSGTNMAANARVIRDSVISVIFEGRRLTKRK
jgi:hypothetical protein